MVWVEWVERRERPADFPPRQRPLYEEAGSFAHVKALERSEAADVRPKQILAPRFGLMACAPAS